ncbi:MAG: uroporphyrinogen-III C-methyltransferase [Candidatus Thorarchaeota archaeon]
MVVYLVGAGPGDPELITVKAKHLIENAEVLIYDRLLNEEIINWANPSCKIKYMGKREKDYHNSQQIQKKINATLIKYGQEYLVVRLKGGDPFIFGRGGEEALICEEAGIKYEIVPGISSFYAVPAYSGIPITHREFNSSFAVLTGHESAKAKSAIDWSKLPETIVILMGVGKIKEIANKLLDAGRDPSTLVAVIRWGTTINQKTIISNLGEIAKGIEGLAAPSIFVIGSIVRLHSKLNWFERKLNLLKDKKIVLARANKNLPEDEELFRAYEIKPVVMPLIEIVPKEYSLPPINDYDALVFTSAEGVKQVIGKFDFESYKGTIFAIGPKTREKIVEVLKHNAFIGKTFNSEGLGKYILENFEEGKKILLLRSSAANKTLSEMLISKFNVSELYLYDIKNLDPAPDLVEDSDAIFVLSASCAKNLMQLERNLLNIPVIVSIGPETSRYLTIPHITSSVHTIQGMINEYLNYLWREHK